MTDIHKMKTADLRNIIKKYKIETGKKIRPISRLTKSKLIEIINEYQMVGDGDAGEAYTPGKPESDDESETLDIVEGVNDMDLEDTGDEKEAEEKESSNEYSTIIEWILQSIRN